MVEFCKIINTGRGQILITKEYEEEDDSYGVKITTEGIFRISTTVGGFKEDQMEDLYKDMDEEKALDILSSVLSMGGMELDELYNLEEDEQ